MKYTIWVFVGSGIGGLLRYGLAMVLSNGCINLPLHTFVANSIASVIVGMAMGYLANVGDEPFVKYAIAIGICGGLSTYSTFSYELFRYAIENQWWRFVLYGSLTFALCLTFTALGFYLAKICL